MLETTLTLRKMNCGHCVRAVDAALRRVPGVRDARVSVGEAVITTEGAPDREAIRVAIEAEGFELA